MRHLIFLLALPFWFLSSKQALGQTTLWDTLPFKLNQSPRTFLEDKQTDKLWIAGNFFIIDGAREHGVMIYDGQNYELPFQGQDFLNTPLASFKYKGNIYIGGGRGLVKVVDTQLVWIDTTAIVYGATYDQARDRMLIYGQFSQFGGVSTAGVAVWDGQAVSGFYGIDSLIDGGDQIFDVEIYQDQFYVGGNINRNTLLQEFMRWDGNKWTDVGGGIPTGGSGAVAALQVYENELYVAGNFAKHTGAPGDAIAKWDGNQWHEVGGGIGPGIEARALVREMLIYKDQLWVLGGFDLVGGLPISKIARWDGESWCGIGTNIEGGLSTMGIYRDTLYIGGKIWSMDGDSSFSDVAQLLDPTYADTCTEAQTTVSIIEKPSQDIRIYPTPGSDQLSFAYPKELRIQKIEVMDAKGQYIVSQPMLSTIYTASWPRGIYLVKIYFNNHRTWTDKWIKY